MVYSNTIYQNQLNHSTAIDSLRVFATLIVFMLHTSILTNVCVNLWRSGGPAVFLFKTPAWAGVWIFFILSGYLIGKGWANHRYAFTIKGVGNFYLKRIMKVLIPTWFFIFLCCALLYPGSVMENPTVIIKFLTITYNGNPGFPGIGATWYIFSIMQLYLITPIIFFFIEKINKKSPNLLIVVLVFIIMAGMLYRAILFKRGVDWHSLVYTPSFSNLDLFTSGFVLSYITSASSKTTFINGVAEKIIDIIKLSRLKALSVILLMSLIIYNCWLYFNGWIYIYKYIFPSVYILNVCFFLFAFDYDNSSSERSTVTTISIFKTRLSGLVHSFSNISFEFYLLHSLVLFQITRYFAITSPIVFHVEVLIYAAVITTTLAYGYSKLFTYGYSKIFRRPT